MSEQGTQEWHQERLGKVTASQITNVMMKPTTAGYQNYKAQLICERLTGEPTESFTNAAMEWGTATEPQARAFYELENGKSVEQVGFVDHPKLGMSGASPDGLVGGDGLVEIKCPKTATHIGTLTTAKIDRKYLLQMHWQMLCTQREWCDFVSFDPRMPVEMQMFVKRVDLDAELAEEITAAVTQFLAVVDSEMSELKSRYSSKAAA